MRKIFSLVLVLIASPAMSECMQDSSGGSFCGEGPCARNADGEVFCAPHGGGTAIRKDSGEVVCGFGSCTNGPYGGVYCAIEPGGAVLRSESGEIECAGGCEAGIAQLCQRIPAEQ